MRTSRISTRTSLGLLIAIGLAAAVLSFLLGASLAQASGGISTGSGGDPSGSRGSESKYERLWDRVSSRDKRWAKKTAECESGGDPRAIGGGGMYRGAFMFLKSSWRDSPKSPGGDPIKYPYKT